MNPYALLTRVLLTVLACIAVVWGSIVFRISEVEVLLQQCTLAWDAKRYLKRLLRTSLLGQWGFHSPGKCVPASEGA